MIHAQTPELVTPPAAPLISTYQAKTQCRVDGDDEDELIAAYVQAAVSWLDGYAGVLGRCLISQTWRQRLDRFPTGASLGLQLAPIVSVVVTYRDEDGVEQTLSSDDYILVSRASSFALELVASASWPATADRADAVSINMVCGYGATPDLVPAAIRQAALMMVAHFYEHREAVVIGTISAEMPLAVRHLLAPYRRLIV